MTRVTPMVRNITETVLGRTKMRVGAKVQHPDGHWVLIISGQYWGEYGISNHWSWQNVMQDGSLHPKVHSGYGW